MKSLVKKVRRKSFITDGEFSEKDYLLLASTSVFFLFITIGLIMILAGQHIDPTYLTLLETVSDVVMAIVISLFGVDGVGQVTSYLENKNVRENETERVQSEDDVTIYKKTTHEEETNYKREDDII